MFQSLDFFVLSCVFLTVGSQTGQILPPQNVTLRWIDPFHPELSWANSMENCTYTYSELGKDDMLIRQVHEVKQSPHDEYLSIPRDEGDQIHSLAVETVCNGKRSARSTVRIYHSGLVKNVKCAIISPKQSHCSWTPTRDVPDLGFFYRLRTIENDVIQPVQACSSYNYTGGNRTGCDLQANITQSIDILLNGTLNEPVRNTFKQEFVVTPPPLNWTVVKNGNKFDISWVPPNIGSLSNWSFKVNYTECDEIKEKPVEALRTSTELEPAPHCRCCMSIKAEWSRFGKAKDGWTPWTKEKCFDPFTDPNSLVYVAIVVPLMFAGLAVLTFACCRKNKDSIFPKVPEPRDFLSDISDNNNKGNVRNLYIPAEEEEACKITLVIDPQNNKHDF